jgi:NACHT domain-containing protein
VRESNFRLGSDLTSQVNDLKSQVIDIVSQLKTEFENQVAKSKIAQLTALESVEGMLAVRKQPDSSRISELARNLRPNIDIGNRLGTTIAFLSSLKYHSRELRRSNIVDAHMNTYQWAYLSDFSRWFESDSSFFWVSGKPGSGKSTLMKYLVHNPSTELRLKSWAANKKLLIIDYFFWINGTSMQRSLERLFRSLLLDILRACPDLIERTFPSRWNAMNIAVATPDLQEPWTIQELISGFRGLTLKSSLSTALCIFIDGLDEFDGEHEDLVTLIKSLTPKSSSVKMCLASRAWNVFESTLGHDNHRKIYLQDFNKEDIRLFVKDKLERRPEFTQLKCNQPEAQQLTNES